MIIGHLGIALDLKSLRRRLPLGWLVVAVFLPDIVSVLLREFARGRTLNLLSHSLPAIAIESVAVTAMFALRRADFRGALVLCLACWTHYPLDLLTGCKVTWKGGPVIGLGLYQSPLIEFPLEAAFFIASWWVFRKRWPSSIVARGSVLGVLLMVQLSILTLIAAQTGFIFVGRQAWRWTPTESLFRLVRMPPPWGTCPWGSPKRTDGAEQVSNLDMGTAATPPG